LLLVTHNNLMDLNDFMALSGADDSRVIEQVIMVAADDGGAKYRGRQSTMTAAQVQAIRDRVAAGEKKAALAREFGVTRQTIYNMRAA